MHDLKFSLTFALEDESEVYSNVFGSVDDQGAILVGQEKRRTMMP
jgi:hypothetical protein